MFNGDTREAPREWPDNGEGVVGENGSQFSPSSWLVSNIVYFVVVQCCFCEFVIQSSSYNRWLPYWNFQSI